MRVRKKVLLLMVSACLFPVPGWSDEKTDRGDPEMIYVAIAEQEKGKTNYKIVSTQRKTFERDGGQSLLRGKAGSPLKTFPYTKEGRDEAGKFVKREKEANSDEVYAVFMEFRNGKPSYKILQTTRRANSGAGLAGRGGGGIVETFPRTKDGKKEAEELIRKLKEEDKKR